MENTSYVALSRQTSLWRELEVVANNLANVNTPGYRGRDVVFTDYMVKTRNDDSVFQEQVNFVQDYGTAEDLTQGALKQTGNPMDLALENKGYFAVEGPDGEKYTRAGRFMMDADGKVVDSNGDALLTDAGTPLFIAPNESQFMVARDGTVSTENGVIGKLKIVEFKDEQALRNVGANKYDALPGQDATPVEIPQVAQGSIEESNVNGVVEITKLIDLQRSYGHVNQMLEKENERTGKAMDVWSRQV